MGGCFLRVDVSAVVSCEVWMYFRFIVVVGVAGVGVTARQEETVAWETCAQTVACADG